MAAKKKPEKTKRTSRNPKPANDHKATPRASDKFNSTYVRFPDKITDEATGRTVLIDAIIEGDREKIARLLEAGSNPNKATKDGKSPLHYAVKLGHGDICDMILDAGAQLNPRDKELKTPMFDALSSPNPKKMVDFLLEAGVSADIEDSQGRIPLHAAAESGSTDVIKSLAAKTANPTRPDARGVQPLHLAAEKNTVDAVQALLFERVGVFSSTHDGDTVLHLATTRKDSDDVALFLLKTEAAQLVNAVNLSGRSPLHLAVLHKKESLSQAYLNLGADVNLPDKQGFTPLHEACDTNNLRMARLLISSGADVGKVQQLNRVTPLILSIRRGNKAMAEMLLDNSADANLADGDGITPLMSAASKPDSAIAGLLLAAGANTTAKDRLGRNVLQHCSAMLDETVMKSFIDAGADINNRDTWQRAPLLTAMTERNAPLIKLLLNAGADPNVKDDQGSSPLYIAMQQRLFDQIDLLLKKGADPNIKDRWSEQPMLSYACVLGLESVVKKLIDGGADINAVDRDGRTPLHHAVLNSWNSSESVRHLLEAGADPLKKDKQGWSAFDMAFGLDKSGPLKQIRDKLKKDGITTQPKRYNPWGGPSGF